MTEQVIPEETQKEMIASWEKMLEEIAAVAEKHKCVGISVCGFFPYVENDKLVAMPSYASALMPNIPNAAALYRLRDQMLAQTKQVADHSIERVMLRADEAAAKAAAEPAIKAEIKELAVVEKPVETV